MGNGSLTANGSLSGVSGGMLSACNAYVGSSGTGTFVQSGGTANFGDPWGGSLYLGYNAADAGTYTLTGTAVLLGCSQVVGNGGTGTFNQSAGTNSIGNRSGITWFPSNNFSLYLGYNAASHGTYNLGGSGVLSVAGSEVVGYSGSGIFIQSGGTNTGGLYLAYNAGSSGSYTLSGPGLLSAANCEYVGYSGTGTFSQSGGSNEVANLSWLCLGCQPGSSGSYNLSGSGFLSASAQVVGNGGTGTFIQSGGTNSFGGYLAPSFGLVIGSGVGSNGVYSLSGSGLLTGSCMCVGYSGTGTFTQSAGTTNVASTEPPPPARRWVPCKIVSYGLEVLRSRFGDLEVIAPVVGFRAVLLFQVLHDDFIRYVPAASDEVPSGPQVPTPELLRNVFELHHQLPGTLALDVLHDLAGRQVRRARQEHVDVVPGHRPLQDFNVVGATNLPYQLTQAQADLADQHRLAVLGNPHKMVFQIVSGMRTVAVVLHGDPF